MDLLCPIKFNSQLLLARTNCVCVCGGGSLGQTWVLQMAAESWSKQSLRDQRKRAPGQWLKKEVRRKLGNYWYCASEREMGHAAWFTDNSSDGWTHHYYSALKSAIYERYTSQMCFLPLWKTKYNCNFTHNIPLDRAELLTHKFINNTSCQSGLRQILNTLKLSFMPMCYQQLWTEALFVWVVFVSICPFLFFAISPTHLKGILMSSPLS